MNLFQDVRFAVRLLIKDKWFTAVAVIALALGIGVNATVFTFVNAVLIRGLPFNDPDRILVVGTRDGRARDRGVSYQDFVDWRAATRTFSGLAAYSGQTMNVSDEGRTPERYQGPYQSANSFTLIGQKPLLGRDFLPEDDRPGAAAVVILGNGVWKNRYGSDPSVLGRTIKVNEMPATVIGVMPEGFKFPVGADLWMPLAQTPQLTQQKRDARNIEVFGRLADRVTLAQAQSEMNTIAGKLARDYPDTNKDISARVMTFNERVNGGPIRLIFLSLMGAVGFVLLIACANVANLLLARSASRAREMSVRLSLGASRWRIVRQLLVESVLLSVISGLLGLALAYVGVRLFDLATQDVGKPYWIQFTMDGQVFAFFAAVCLGTSVVFGLAPALHVSKTDLNEVLKEGGRSGSSGMRARRWTSVLIVAELALTLVLLAGAGLMMRSFLNLYRLDVGVETSHLLTMRLNLPNQKYPTPEQRRVFYDRLDQRLAGLGGIQAATLTTNAPLGGGIPRLLSMDGKEPAAGEQPPTVTQVTIGPRC
jgi:predicted permease